MDTVLCGANAQSMRWYFNEEDFGILPEKVKKEQGIHPGKVIRPQTIIPGTFAFPLGKDIFS